MRLTHGLTFALLSAVWLCVTAATAQDFHVETTLYAINRPQPKELMRSVTLFHAGKTYDFIQDMGELIIFDPAHGKFTLVNTRQRRTAEVHFDEINRMLGIAKRTLNDHLTTMQGSPKPDQDAIDQILFQFNPQFDETVTQTNAGPQLLLKSKYFDYQVVAASAPTPPHGFAYLNYADWICRLNYVLNPGRILPDQRIALNAALRTKNLIPIDVTFKSANSDQLKIQALHHIYWTLNERDRELLRQWDGMLSRGELKRVPFKEYQKSLLMSQVSHKR